MRFGDYIGTAETKYVEDKMFWRAWHEFIKSFDKPMTDRDMDILLLFYGKQKNLNPQFVWLYNTIHNEILGHKHLFTQDFYSIDIPESFSKEDADKLISILRKSGIDYGLHIRRLDTHRFVTQWKKEYILASDVYLNPKGADQYKRDIRTEMGMQILSQMNGDFSSYTRDVWEIYFRENYDYPIKCDIDPAGKYGIKYSEFEEVVKKRREERADKKNIETEQIDKSNDVCL